MVKKIFLPFFIFVCTILFTCFSSYSQNMAEQKEEIKVLDSTDKILTKRQNEARKLIEKGDKLIKKGTKKGNQKLVKKGKIIKEIGEKQLKNIQENIKQKKEEDKKYDY